MGEEDAYGLKWGDEEHRDTTQTPWEREDGWSVADLFRSWMQIMTRPGEFFRSLDPDVSFARPLIFYLVFAVLGSWASTLSWMALFGDTYRELYALEGLESFPLDAYMWMNLFLSPFWALITLLIHVGMVHVGVRMFVKDARPIGVTTRTLCYVAAPWILAIVPVLGWAVSFIWMAAMAIIGIQWTHRTTFGRAFAAVIVPPFVVTTALTMLFVLLGGLISASVGQLAQNVDAYQEQLGSLLAELTTKLPLERFGVSVEAQLDPLSQIPASAVGNMLLGTTNALVEILSQSILVLIFVVFLLIGSGGRTPPLTGVWSEIESNIQLYLGTKAALSAATGILVGVTLGVLGVDLALVFGLFAFLLNFIPSVGSVIATLLPLPVVLVSPELSTLAAVLAIAIPGTIQFAIGNVIEPKIMGDTLDLHPIVILIMLIFWGILWGIPGMLLATPITAVLKILFGKLEQTRPLAQLLAGRLVPGA